MSPPHPQPASGRAPQMVSPAEALDLIRAAAPHGRTDNVQISNVIGRICAQDIYAALTQPPFNSSAMDGYAVRFEDARQSGAVLSVIGEAPAGAPFGGMVGKGQAVRIFTGSVVPSGADHIIIQEDVSRIDNNITVTADQPAARNIRFAGTDFKQGDIIKRAGQTISSIDACLLAGANIASLQAAQKPVIAYFDNGDELVEPGQARAPGQIIGSNRFALHGLITRWGGEPLYLGRARDSAKAVSSMLARGLKSADNQESTDNQENAVSQKSVDIIVPIGGASVGDHDYVRGAFEALGGTFSFEKIAVKPGKPTWFGQIHGANKTAQTCNSPYVLGLPGNPASAIICAILFLQPLIARLSGQIYSPRQITAKLSVPLGSNGPRETYLRAWLSFDAAGQLWARPADLQDSSLMSRLAGANGLIKCPPHMGTKDKTDRLDCLLYGDIGTAPSAL